MNNAVNELRLENVFSKYKEWRPFRVILMLIHSSLEAAGSGFDSYSNTLALCLQCPQLTMRASIVSGKPMYLKRNRIDFLAAANGL